MKSLKETVAFYGTFFVVCTVAVLISILFRGYCLSLLWAWLIVPVFHLPKLSIAAALGLCVIVNFLLSPKRAEESLGESLMVSGVVLVLGYVIHLFI